MDDHDLDLTDYAPGVSPGDVYSRKIIHIDQDAFYASTEQRDNPELRGKPVAVGGVKERGVVAAASYEARKFGVRSAMPGWKARRQCPELIFVPPRFDVYRAVSAQIREIFSRYTDLIEPLSLDEAYLDVTENKLGIETATEVANRIRADILAETNLTASAGISYNKFLAKMSSGQNKPNGFFVLTPKTGPAFVERLDIAKFHGVGPATADRFRRLGVTNGAELKGLSLDALTRHFGKAGPWFHGIARGIDTRPVRPDRERKSIGAETTFVTDLSEFEPLYEQLVPLIDKVWAHCERTGKRGRTVTLKLKDNEFQQITRAKSVGSKIQDKDVVAKLLHELLSREIPLPRPIRLIGLTVSGFEEDEARDGQLALAI